MNVYLSENGDQLPGDVVVDWTSRSDLVPIPRSLEFTVKLVDGLEKRLVKGGKVWSGRENLCYRIVKTNKAPPIGEVQGNNQQQAMQVTALLDSCCSLSEPLAKAVVLYSKPFSAILRACGAYVAISSDFTVPRFVCMRGQTPAYAIATILQEEGAALVLRGGKIAVMRLTDLAKQSPVDDIGQVDSSAKIESDFLQQHEVPTFFSVTDTGAIKVGPSGQSRVVSFMPRGDVRQLRNASCVLVRNHTVDSQLCQQIQAGDVLRVAGGNYVVITAAHAERYNNGAMESQSRLWLGSVINAR